MTNLATIEQAQPSGYVSLLGDDLPKKTCQTVADGVRLCEQEQLDGDQGIYQTMYLMRDLARRDARDERIIALARKHQGKTDIETAYNIFMWMVKKFPYKSDPTTSEFVNAPVHTLFETMHDEYPYRDCDDFSAAYASLLKAVGFKEQYFKAIAWRKHDYTHVYNYVYFPSIKGYLPIDLVMKDKGFGAQKLPQIRSMHIKV